MKVGFIGVGFMGKHMARHIIEGGHELTIYDISETAAKDLVDLGAKWANSPSIVATNSEVIFTSLPTPQDVEQVVIGEGGLLDGAIEGTTFFDLSTTDPETITRISESTSQKGVTLLDAPVSGGTTGAEEGTLCVMVGGDKSKYDKYKSVLDLIGTQVVYCGNLGAGAVCKIVNNLIGMTLGVVLSEAFSLGVKAGVDPMTLYNAVSMSSGETRQMHTFPTGLFEGNFEPGFKLDLGSKDVGLATNLGRSLRVPMEVSNLVHQKYVEAQNKGWGGQSTTAIAKLQEERAGVEIRSLGL
ncbi:MAG: NAD(P)-dependent oxidoreductase [SAR202 cluster bacterium]|jgi:3-hydroxyisobutyrate dehydrogenase-like beta-hydroxyacid dehydrogenase|nr:MAG: NAD(P)-dependent oxidoreductase [SAR202 cluster bacterium]MCH2319223.1 NAD(P)-dependent oxidoreductase [SAR202 cluster bacterium]MEC7884442.1 NAD(P)-dependent oxidoreductase [Chloroflexota bacterium]MQF68104.1 NAD(P)-dependent oxidoreductase [SAR202 cluster bacterium AD-802-K11_MRT_200m]MQG75029.1 NAD(P)-dependent oxidoreductase [SAR202 cluster bacterium]|tara:strand:- start:12028 stop:12921 length:894 start_codon:yes stop_codon:yes gene_type:complete